MMRFENEERRRKYGKREGDIVYRYNTPDEFFEVVSIQFMDNNRFKVRRLSDNVSFEDTPEHYEIKTKVEEITRAKTEPEIYLQMLLKEKYNVYSDFFVFYIQKEPFKMSIRFSMHIKSLTLQKPDSKIVSQYIFTEKEVRQMMLIAEVSDSAYIFGMLTTLDEKIKMILDAVEVNQEQVKGYIIDRSFSQLMTQMGKSHE